MKNFDITLDLLAYEGATTNIPADAVRVKNRTQETEIVTLNRLQFTVADATTDLAIAIPGDNTLYTILLVDRQITIKLNGSTDAITLTPRANGTKTFAFYTRGSITALTVTNASGAAANLDAIVARK